MNDLETYFNNNKGRLIHKWTHYFPIYERHFSRFRGLAINVLEIGVSHGGSLQMWKHYFGSEANIYGIDINPECKKFEESQVKIFIGDQSSEPFLNQVIGTKKFHVVIDDGSHINSHQIKSLDIIYPHLAGDSVYLCEDVHTSYLAKYRDTKENFIDHSSLFIDRVNAAQAGREHDHCDHSVHYYSGIVVIERRPTPNPSHRKTGYPSLPLPFIEKLKHIFE